LIRVCTSKIEGRIRACPMMTQGLRVQVINCKLLHDVRQNTHTQNTHTQNTHTRNTHTPSARVPLQNSLIEDKRCHSGFWFETSTLWRWSPGALVFQVYDSRV
jgi:hypothetical protein